MTNTAQRVYNLAIACGAFAPQVNSITPDQREAMREVLGAKAAGLAEVMALGIHAPPGVTIATSVCREFYANGEQLPDGLYEEVLQSLRRVELQTGYKLGDDFRPLLVSVRAGAKVPMPGMMDTILNLGLNEMTTEALAQRRGERVAYDCYRRFIEAYSSIVLGVPKEHFARILNDAVARAGVPNETHLNADQVKEVVEIYQTFVWDQTGNPFPRDVNVQLRGAICAVFKSWNSERAVRYRRAHHISDDIGAAVTVQAMVFGNLNDQSATGICFTRDPGTGTPVMTGEYLVNAQGGDVAASVRQARPFERLAEDIQLDAFQDLLRTANLLEVHFRDAQEIHFTVENGYVFILQTRAAAATAEASVRIAVDLVGAGLISKEQAVKRIKPKHWAQLLRPTFTYPSVKQARELGRHVATGFGASPGVATGSIVFDAREAAARGEQGEKVILVSAETCPGDIGGIIPVQGIVTERGGMCCFGAGAARGQGKPCITGCESLKVDRHNNLVIIGKHSLFKNDVISIDGASGEIFTGVVDTQLKQSSHLSAIVSWATELGINVGLL